MVSIRPVPVDSPDAHGLLEEYFALRASIVYDTSRSTTSSGVPAKDMKEFIAWVKQNPGKLAYASSGTGGVMHISGEILAKMAGLQYTHVPYKERREGVWYLNPGSVSIPKENSAHSYMTLDERGFQWKSFDGTVYDALSLEEAERVRTMLITKSPSIAGGG